MRHFRPTLLSLMIILGFSTAMPDTLFFDNFNDGNDSGWKKPADGSWVVESNEYHRSLTSGADNSTLSYVGNTSWINYTVETDINLIEDLSGGWAVLCFRVKDSANFYYFEYEPHSGRIAVNALVNGTYRILSYPSYPCSKNTWYRIKITVKNDSIGCYINNNPVIQLRDTLHARGGAGLASWHAHTHFDNFLVTLPPVTPRLLAVPSPSHDRRPRLLWHPVRNASVYTVQIDTSLNFLATLTTVPASDTFFLPLINLPVGTIYWRVKSDLSAVYSPIDSFRILSDSVPMLITMSPDTIQNPPPLLRWHKGTGAQTYRIQIDTTGHFLLPWAINLVSDTFFQPPVNLPLGRICWRVSNADYNPNLFSGADTFWVKSGTSAEAPGDSISGPPGNDGPAPNPFNPATTIRWSVPAAVHGSLTIYDLAGKKAACLFNGIMTQGRHSVMFDARSLKTGNAVSGMFFARLRIGPSEKIFKLVLMK